MVRKIRKLPALFTFMSALLICSLVTPTGAMPQAQTFTDNERVPISGTVFDCAGNPVTITGEVHLMTHTTISPSGHFTVVSHLNQNLQGTSADGTQHVMNQQLQETITGD